MKVMAIKTIKQSSHTSDTVRAKILYTLILFLCLLWCSLIIFKPILAAGNSTSQKASALITFFFSPICHQLAERSFYIQGHSLAVCTRCAGIYFGFLLGIIIYPFFRKWDSYELPSNRILFAGCVPSILVFMISRFDLIEQNALLRSITGLILGGVVSFFVLPAIFNANQNRKRLSHFLYFRKKKHNHETNELRPKQAWPNMPYNT